MITSIDPDTHETVVHLSTTRVLAATHLDGQPLNNRRVALEYRAVPQVGERPEAWTRWFVGMVDAITYTGTVTHPKRLERALSKRLFDNAPLLHNARGSYAGGINAEALQEWRVRFLR